MSHVDGVKNLSGPQVENSSTIFDPDENINTYFFYKTEQFTILVTLFVMIVLGNSAVLLTLTLNKNRKSRMNFFIKQLAIADLTVGLISVLTDIIWRITVEWHAGNIACKLIRFLQAIVTFSSTYVLVALSIDRYDAITHPMNFSGSWRRARVLVVSAWLISIIFSIPVIFLFEEKTVQGQVQCWIELEQWQWQIYITVIAIALLVAPAIIISACYAVIVWTIWSKSKLLVPVAASAQHHIHIANALVQNNHARRTSSDQRVLRHYEDHDTRRASSRGIIPKAKIKTVKMTFVIVFVFILCWSPYFIFDLLQVYGYIPRTQTNTAIATLVQSLAPLNSAANPLIYCLFSTHMCRTLRKLRPFRWLARGFESGSCIQNLRRGNGGHGLQTNNSSTRTTLTNSLCHYSSNRRNNSTTAQLTVRHTIRINGPEIRNNSENRKMAMSVL